MVGRPAGIFRRPRLLRRLWRLRRAAVGPDPVGTPAALDQCVLTPSMLVVTRPRTQSGASNASGFPRIAVRYVRQQVGCRMHGGPIYAWLEMPSPAASGR